MRNVEWQEGRNEQMKEGKEGRNGQIKEIMERKNKLMKAGRKQGRTEGGQVGRNDMVKT